LTAEHGRRIVRNALAIWNERCGHVGHAEMMTQPNGDDVTTRAIITAGWAYVGPMHYFCPAPVGTPNASRPNPTITLYLVGRATGSATSYVYAINENVGAPGESQMDTDVAGVGDAWADISTATWTATLKVQVSAGWNRIWLAFKCGTYGEPQSLSDFVDDVEYYPYVAEMNATGRAASSHPAVFSPRGTNRDCPGKALILAVSATDYAAGAGDTPPLARVVAADPRGPRGARRRRGCDGAGSPRQASPGSSAGAAVRRPLRRRCGGAQGRHGAAPRVLLPGGRGAAP
jgi:hypothetical protein